MAIRDIYLKIETIPGYCPVYPMDHAPPPRFYGRDCMYGMGHEDGLIPQSEINSRTLTALIYREYLDPGYTIPKPDKLISTDVNEPTFDHRVPGTVIYCHPGDRLRIHVLNWDLMPHSFHLHGLAYGIDGDGSWPFGTISSDGRRSDEICPGQSWTYVFDVTDDMVGAWPFHDHYQHLEESVNRGLFGGIVVRPRERPLPPGPKLPHGLHHLLEELREHPRPIPGPGPHFDPLGHHHPGHHAHGGGHTPHAAGHAPSHEHAPGPPLDHRILMELEFLREWAQLDHVHPRPTPERTLHVPLFVHVMTGSGGIPAFDSPDLNPGAVYTAVLGAEGTYGYHCRFHANMQGMIEVIAGGPPMAAVTIRDAPSMLFDPPTVSIGPGGMVQWTNAGAMTHSATEDAAGIPTYCLNGRSFIGNSPTVEVHAGQAIRWYVFNLDLGMMWHNFHTHGQRWRFANETIDVRSLSPAESFVVETTGPDVVLLPPDAAGHQAPGTHLPGAQRYDLRGDFLVHCHAEMHMMQGLGGLVRSRQSVWLTPAQATALAAERGLPLDPGGNACPAPDMDHCEVLSCGYWEEVPGDPEVVMMHAALLPQTERVLYWGYTRADQSRLWDAGGGGYQLPANQPASVAVPPGDINVSDLWSAEHAFLNTPEGILLAHGGFSPDQAFLFNPATSTWARTSPTAQERFYSTSLTLADGKVLTLFGSASQSIEVYDPVAGTWAAPIPLPGTFLYVFYPWTYLMPGGDLFIGGPTGVSRRFTWSAPVDDPAKTWNTIGGNRSTYGEKGTSVLLPLRPPGYEVRVLIAGGNTPTAEKTAELMDLSAATPAWAALPDLNFPRPEQFTAVLLPDGTVMVAGGVFTEPDGGPAEILDPEDIAAGWKLCASMGYKRGYHSSNILLPDGSVLMGGDPGGAGGPTPHERYFPWYCSRPRPTITVAPAAVAYGASFNIQSPDAPSIAEVVLVRPGAVTHGFNQSQRFVGCEVTAAAGTMVTATAPPDGTVAPPGWYLLFVVDGSRVPSVATWIRLS
jgi:FtsP/CotA-like multicopper oxidase with cupredoxin domain